MVDVGVQLNMNFPEAWSVSMAAGGGQSDTMRFQLI
jgi:hypothetical protein